MRVQTYQETLDENVGLRRHLLLGNGFSIAADARFQYASLLDEAFSETDIRLREIFLRAGTTDFEVVLSKLDTARDVLSCYPGAENFVGDIGADRTLIANRLIAALAAIHPAASTSLTDGQYARSGEFLAEMRRADTPDLSGLFFTTNYDLLLYWSTMRNFRLLRTRDGFSGQGLQWAPEENQSVFHLHGALHLYVRDDGSIGKLRYDTPLIEQISALINRDMLPLFVSEGSSVQKLERINANQYLRDALTRFEGAVMDDGAVLYVFGSALNDAHIADLIAQGRVGRVYISAHNVEGSRLSVTGLEARWIEQRRQAGLPQIEVVVFAATEAGAWADRRART
ncbi:MAG: DUF4917 family protein [Pseudolabrys sp.]|nr:DUF4917 family protein [Pseudolabrys sp.]